MKRGQILVVKSLDAHPPNWHSPHSSKRLRTSSLTKWAKPHSHSNEHERTNTFRYVDILARIHTKSGFHKRSNCDSGVNGFAENENGHHWDEADFSRF